MGFKRNFWYCNFFKIFLHQNIEINDNIRKILTYNSKSFSTFSFIKLWNVAYLFIKNARVNYRILLKPTNKVIIFRK